jgi:hypothetical protein
MARDDKGGAGSSTLTREHYEFTLLGTENLDGHPSYVLGLKPKQKRNDLLIGRAWIDQSTYLPRLIDGDMSKSPSWWLKKVHLRLSFADFGGMWLQDGARAVADVRFLGEHTLTSQAMDYRNAVSVSQNSPPGSDRRRRTPRQNWRRATPAAGIVVPN